MSTSEQQVGEWRACLVLFPEELLDLVERLADTRQVELASHFYTQMLADPGASQYLSHEQVRDRLSQSMQRWVVQLFAARSELEVTQQVAQQRHIGEVHARIGVPVYLVLRGARSLKRRIYELIDQGDWTLVDKLAGMRLSGKLIDLAMEVMSLAYSHSHDRNARAEEAYRLFSVVQNIGAERERQRAALLDWENALIYDLAMGQAVDRLPRLGGSEFGLWFNHKGSYAFRDAAESQQIIRSMAHIDDELLPLFSAAGLTVERRMQLLGELRERTKGLVFLLDALFEQANELESGRDVLTRMLNRKFLSVVMGKEVAHARQNNQTFAVLAIDIDLFKQVNDQYGHEAGDMVLQQMAMLLSNHGRGGDYLFRLGGEEFLMLVVNVGQRGALGMAESLRRKVEQERFRLPNDETYRLTVSIGLALHDGHPDYQKLLRRADEALYRAKNGGRNRVVVYGEG